MNREDTFKSVYGVEAPKAVLGLFIEDLKQVKRKSKAKQYQGLLELLLRYSYAIFYDYKTVSIINNRLKYRQEAMKILNSEDVEEAFSFIARATKPKETDLEKLKRLREELKELDKEGMEYSAMKTEIEELSRSIDLSDTCVARDELKRLKEELKELDKEGMEYSAMKTEIEELSRSIDLSDTCVARDEIKRLKKELDTKSYTLAKGQKEEDEQAFIKVALVALSTGARLKEITETLELSVRKGIVYFIVDGSEEEGIILELDAKTIRGYLKDIRRHYSERIKKGTDISTGIRKAVARMSVPFAHTTTKGIYREYATNLNHLNTLYDKCLTSSAQ